MAWASARPEESNPMASNPKMANLIDVLDNQSAWLFLSMRGSIKSMLGPIAESPFTLWAVLTLLVLDEKLLNFDKNKGM